jgi:hypothetical protein
MQIADLELETAVPADLEQRLHALTGASIAEVRSLLDGRCLAGFVAKALHPLLAEAHELAELARKIAEHGIDAVKAEVAALYDEAVPAAGDPEAQHGGQSDEAPGAEPSEPPAPVGGAANEEGGANAQAQE